MQLVLKSNFPFFRAFFQICLHSDSRDLQRGSFLRSVEFSNRLRSSWLLVIDQNRERRWFKIEEINRPSESMCVAGHMNKKISEKKTFV